jgi:hypothetical protein
MRSTPENKARARLTKAMLKVGRARAATENAKDLVNARTRGTAAALAHLAEAQPLLRQAFKAYVDTYAAVIGTRLHCPPGDPLLRAHELACRAHERLQADCCRRSRQVDKCRLAEYRALCALRRANARLRDVNEEQDDLLRSLRLTYPNAGTSIVGDLIGQVQTTTTQTDEEKVILDVA